MRDRLAHRVRNAAGNGKAAARRRAFAQRSGLGDLGEVDALCLEHAHDLFKRQNKIDLAAHARAHGFELFRAARPDERDLLAGVLLLAEARREHHGRERHGDAVRLLREELFCHICPARAAGCRHERLLSGDLLQKVLCLVERAEIRADGYLRHMAKAEHFHRGLELVRRHIRAELADKRGRNDRNDLFTAAQRLNELEQLALIRDRTERTVHKAHAAGDAFIVIDLGAPMLVGADGVHAARLGARALLQNNRVVGADVRALSAADAEILLNAAHAAVAELDRLFRADLAARMRQTVLTEVRDDVTLFRAGVAGKFQDVHQRRLIVFLRSRALLHTGGKRRVLVERTGAQPHCETEPLADNRSFQKDAAAVLGDLAGNDLVWQILNAGVVAALVAHAGDLREYLAANVGDGGINAANAQWKHPLFRFTSMRYSISRSAPPASRGKDAPHLRPLPAR